MRIKNILIIIIVIFFVLGLYAEELKEFSGAEVYSFDHVKYGKFEIRMSTAFGRGTLSTFFLYDNKSWQGLPYMWREIDIEVLGKKKDLMQSNIITGHSTERIMSEKLHNLKRNLSSKYYTYTLEWTPDYLAWYIDGELIRKDNLDSQQVKDLQDTPLTYRMNLWISEIEEWVGKFNKKILPVYYYINWIKYYKYTPKNEDAFTLEWEDDFDSFDTARWGKGDWTFDDNMVQFHKENALVKDGYLILCLTEKGKEGFFGKLKKDKK